MPQDIDVLIVDDERVIGEQLAEHCLNQSLTAKHTTKVRDALSTVKKQHPKIVFVDIFLPELDGFDLAEELFHYSPSSKIVLMSGVYDFNMGNLQQLGFEDFLKKPIDIAQVDMILQKYGLPRTEQ